MTRQDYLNLFEDPSAAVEFETHALSAGSEFLPACAQAVRDGAEPAAEYWNWLCSQVEAAG